MCPGSAQHHVWSGLLFNQETKCKFRQKDQFQVSLTLNTFCSSLRYTRACSQASGRAFNSFNLSKQIEQQLYLFTINHGNYFSLIEVTNLKNIGSPMALSNSRCSLNSFAEASSPSVYNHSWTCNNRKAWLKHNA